MDPIIVKQAIADSKTLSFELSFSERIKEYFTSNKLFFEYDEEINNIEPSLLQIPAIASLITVAWSLGTDIHVKTLDKTYLDALDKIKSVFEKWYPWFSFSTEIQVDNIVINKLNNNGYGLLFSGGIDSTTSYLRHIAEKPVLIAIWGTGKFMHPRVETVENRFINFANKQGIKMDLIGTNLEDVLNFNALYRRFGLDWYVNVFHSIILTGMCAPLSRIDNIKTLFIASSFTKEYNFPCGSHPYIDNNIRWADVEVSHDCYELTRQEKIRHILKKHIANTGDYPFIRTCSRDMNTNCGKCEKCKRTITGLVLENIDPRRCGFRDINSEVFKFIKKDLIQRNSKLFPHIKAPNRIFESAVNGLSLKDFDNVNSVSPILSKTTALVEWMDMQKYIPEIIDHNLLDSRDFYEWFRTFDFYHIKKTRKILNHLFAYILKIYYRLPINIQIFVDRHIKI